MAEQNRSGTYTQIVYAPSGQKLASMNASTLQKAYIPLLGNGMAVYTSSGLSYYRHSDWLSSSRFASTPTAPTRMYWDTAYARFGEPYAQSGSADVSFTGMNQDTVANLYDFPARECGGAQGRWPSPDPAGLAAVDPTNPQSWNRYAYVLNSPCSLVDPLGLDSCNLNIKLNNAANLKSLEGIKGVIETIFQQSSLGQPNSVGVSFVTDGKPDFTLTFNNNGVP